MVLEIQEEKVLFRENGVLRELSTSPGLTQSEGSGESSSKDPLWKLNIPQKVRIFIWKMAHNALATEANLQRHHVPINPRCDICGYHYANTTYAILFYQGIQEI